jgi:glutaredoxin
MAEQVIVYTSNNCRPCDAAKDWLTRHGVAFEARNVNENQAYMDELRALKTLATPCVVIDGQRIRGFDPQKMAELLGIER